MLNKKTISILIAALSILCAFAAPFDTAQAREASSPMKLDVQLAEDIVLDNVVFGEGHTIIFRGRTEDPTATCLPVQIFIDGEREAWWPVLRCVQVNESGEWMVRVPSEDGGSPLSIHFNIGE